MLRQAQHERDAGARFIKRVPATLLAAALLAGSCAPSSPGPVDPARYDQFFLWAGVPPPPAVRRAKVLYILAGEVRRGGAPRFVSLRAGVPHGLRSALWFTVRSERLDWDERTWEVILSDLARWERAGNRMEGLQIDFDAATPGLGGYAAFLRKVRRRLPTGAKLSITGLLDWSAHGDPRALAALSGIVDEAVIQTYQGRTTIPGYADYFRHIDTLPLRHKIALVEGGAWTPPPALARDKRFAGYVVFLLKPRPAPARAANQR
jgi:hypothetical protein